MKRALLLLTVAACSSATVAPLSGGTDDAADASSVTQRDAGPRDAASVQDASSPRDATVVEADAAEEPAEAAAEAGPFACTADPSFPTPLAVPEASAAAEVELVAGVRELLVVSDSGRNGVALARRLDTGVTRALTFPLDAAASDDLEGIAWRDGRLYTLTSSGAVRRFAPDGEGGLVRDQDAYALGAAPYACADLTGINCGKNYEGLCLRAHDGGETCAGYAASKAEGKLYCLDLDASGRLSASTTRAPLSLDVAADQLSDCAFGTGGGPATHALVVATNVYNFSRAYRVDETSGALAELPAPLVLNLEAVAIDHAGALYTFSDDNGDVSVAKKTDCENW